MIGILDYGLGNVQAFLTTFKRLGVDARRVRDVPELEGVDRLILPGVGAFDQAVATFDKSGMRPSVERMVHIENVPILGVCVGMQLLASYSDEGSRAGLGWIPGRVRSFRSAEASKNLPMPHMGWNDVIVSLDNGLWPRRALGGRFYFLHSYYFETEAPEHVLATAEYGLNFGCIVGAGNIYGAQFHPEKSHAWGAQLLKNFAEL